MLSERDAELLAFEQQAGSRNPGAKEELIVRRFGISPVRYYQRLNQLVDCPDAWETHPLLMGRLARIRDRRARDRYDSAHE